MKAKIKKHHGQYRVVLLLLALMMLLSSTAWAGEEVQVDYNICPGQWWQTDEILDSFNPVFGLQSPLVLVLPDGHKDMYITLHAAKSCVFTEDMTGMGTGAPGNPLLEFLVWVIGAASSDFHPGAIDKIYSVQFKDYDGNVVWTEAGAIPNGGSREFFVGSNVKYIAVRSSYSVGQLEGVKGETPGSVVYSNAHEID